MGQWASLVTAPPIALLRSTDTRLLEKSSAVHTIDDELHSTIQQMIRIATTLSGLGLAGSQVGYMRRVCIVREDTTYPFTILINPRILSRGGGTEGRNESCLSFPGRIAYVQRHRKIKIEYQTPENESVQLVCRMLLARVVQHEIDHLDGIVLSSSHRL